ncbi:MAG: hypothetical protein V4604_05145 [Bacteroidota bacterium]
MKLLLTIAVITVTFAAFSQSSSRVVSTKKATPFDCEFKENVNRNGDTTYMVTLTFRDITYTQLEEYGFITISNNEDLTAFRKGVSESIDLLGKDPKGTTRNVSGKVCSFEVKDGKYIVVRNSSGFCFLTKAQGTKLITWIDSIKFPA